MYSYKKKTCNKPLQPNGTSMQKSFYAKLNPKDVRNRRQGKNKGRYLNLYTPMPVC